MAVLLSIEDCVDLLLADFDEEMLQAFRYGGWRITERQAMKMARLQLIARLLGPDLADRRFRLLLQRRIRGVGPKGKDRVPE